MIFFCCCVWGGYRNKDILPTSSADAQKERLRKFCGRCDKEGYRWPLLPWYCTGPATAENHQIWSTGKGNCGNCLCRWSPQACIQEHRLQSRSISWHVRSRVAIGSDKISMGRDFSPMMRVLASDPGACALSINVEQWSPSQDRGDVNEFHSMLATLVEAVPASAICKDARKSVNDEEHSSHYIRVKTCFGGCRFDV